MIQLYDVRNPHGGGQQFRRLVALAQVHVKDAYRGLEPFLKKGLNRFAGLRRSLRQRAKAYRVAAFCQRAPFRSPLQKVPCDGFLDLEFRLPVLIYRNFDSPRGMDCVRLDFAGFPAQRPDARNGLPAKVILTYAAGNHSSVTQEARNVGKICGSAAELLAGGEHVPQKFAKSDDDAAIHVSHRSRSEEHTSE